ncbi:MAG TPA: hypothetical protein VFC25_16060 [Verrucomicrobiae bacterium]|nr:hypothetical protein [Verrucomicrobiae bacterium]
MKPRGGRFAVAAGGTILLLAAAIARSDEPSTLTVSPPRGTTSAPTVVTIRGAAFEPGTRVALLGGGPFLAGAYSLPEGSRSVQARGDRVSIGFYSHASKAGGLQLIDVSDAAHPVRAGGFETGDSGIGVATRGSLGYIAFLNPYTFLGGLHIADLDHPGGALRLGSFYTFTDPQAMALDGTHAYVAGGAEGLRIVDVTDPAAPFEAARLDSRGMAHDVVVENGRALVADGAGGLRVIDVRDPAAPAEMGSWAPAGADLLSVAAGDGAVFATDTTRGLLVFDLADPARPALAAELPLADIASGLARDGSTLAVAAGAAGLQLVNVSDPRHPRVIGSRTLPGNSAYFFDVAAAPGRAYVADLLNGLQILDTSRPAAPSLLGGVDLPGATTSVVADGDLAAAANGAGGIVLLDASGGGSVTGRVSTAGPAAGVSIASRHVLAALSDAGLAVIDAADPTHPILTGAVDTPGEALGVTASGDLAFVADGSQGLALVDWSDRAAPRLLASLDTAGTARGVAVSGSLAYLADDFRGMVIVDVSSPVAPRLVSRFDTPGRASGVVVADGFAYVADLNRGVQVIDVSNPATPRLARTIFTPGAASGIARIGNRLLVADGFAGLLEYDVTTPASPVLVGAYDTPGIATGVAAALSSGGSLLVADGPRGVRAMRLNPGLPAGAPDATEGLRLEIPAGFTPGPYDVQVMSADGAPIAPPIRNAFVVCGGGDLAARLVASRLPSAVGPTPAPWRLEVSGSADLFEPAPRHEARLLLPGLPAEPLLRFDAGRDAIDIAIPRAGAAIVRLSGSDRAALLALWNAALAAGGLPLPRLDARTYGPLRLESHPGEGAGGPQRFRFEFTGGVLTGASSWGDGARLDFTVSAADASGCDLRAETSL